MTDPAKEGEKNLAAILESNLKQMDAMAELVAKQGSTLDEMTKHLTTIDKSLEKTILDRDETKLDPEEKERQEILWRRRIPPPIFKGEKGECPEAHLLRAEDWMKAIGITTEHDHITNFKLTLDHLAKEWYNNTGRKKTTWKSLTTEFSRYFSTQGKSIRNLHLRWNRFKFDPATDYIEEFIRNVQECAAQLNYSDEATMNMIKFCMPKSMYTALYEKETLEAVIEMVVNLFAREIEEDQPKTVAPATPFSMVQDNTSPLQDQISKLTDALCNIDVTRPFKPYITPRGRGRGRGHGKPTRGRGQPFQFQGKRNMTFPKPPTRGRGCGHWRGKYDKSPTQKKPRVAPKAKDMDKERCHFCKQLGHWEHDCPEKKKTGDAKAYDEWVPEDFDIYEDTDLGPGTLPDIFTTIEEELYASLPPTQVSLLSSVMEDREESTQQTLN